MTVTKVKKNSQFWQGVGWVRTKKLIPQRLSHKICETNSSFHLKSCSTMQAYFLFFQKHLKSLDFSGKTEHSIIILQIFKIFMIFPKILRFSNVARQVVYTMFITYKCTSFQFWWKENLIKKSNSLNILWKWLSPKVWFAYSVFVIGSNC